MEKFLPPFEKLARRSKPAFLLLGFLIVGVIGFIDYWTGSEFAFSIFYVFPISFITWFTSRRFGIFASLASAAAWLSADFAAGRIYSSSFIPFWNSFIRLGFFVIITWLLSALRKALQREEQLARHDFLTGAVNSRYFYELAQMEINRCQRYQHPFTLAFIDLDNFKMVNDLHGHAVGDQALCTVVDYIKLHIRRTDIIARLGGDEFAVLFPETNQASARIVLDKLQSGLAVEMEQRKLPVTFSVGVITCTAPPRSTDELLKMADDLMYSVKHNNKNAAEYALYTG